MVILNGDSAILQHTMSLSDFLHKYIADAENTYRELPHDKFEELVQETLTDMLGDGEHSPDEIEQMREVATIRVGESELDSARMRKEDRRIREQCVDHVIEFIEALRRPYLDYEEMREMARNLGDYF